MVVADRGRMDVAAAALDVLIGVYPAEIAGAFVPVGKFFPSAMGGFGAGRQK